MPDKRMTQGAGVRSFLVTIEQMAAPDAAGSAGEPVESFTTLATEWMEKLDATGSEQFRADQLSARYDTRWVMCYRPDMDPDVIDIPKLRRLVYRGRYYGIVNAALIALNEGIELQTVTGSRVNA